MKPATLARFVLGLLALPSFAMAATIGSTLKAKLTALPTAALGTVIVSFNDNGAGLQPAHLDVLRKYGIRTGAKLPNLGMVAVNATVAQVTGLANEPSVRSIYANDPFHYCMHQARVLTGVDRAETDAGFTAANGGLPVSGAGDFSVVINDSGIDATHGDLPFGTKVIQNVQIVVDENTPNAVVVSDPLLNQFSPLLVLENVPNTDTHIGHGTHCAGIVGGTGARSGTLFRGVATGAKLIGCGSGVGEFILNPLGGFEWSLAHQAQYKIRVISNSWGGTGPFEPDSPINIASKRAHDRNIVVVFAAGNEGPAPDTQNPYSKAPWVISVAAGTKEGGLASFSSRGVAQETRLTNSDPLDDYNAPTITAPGTGREFETNASKFTAAIVSTRSLTNVVANGLTNDTEITPNYLPFYTQISGTSMATPHVAGVVALLLEAKPTLTPDEIKAMLIRTATKMPGYADFEVGAGFVNVVAMLDQIRNGTSYAQLGHTSFNAQVDISRDATEHFSVDYSPSATAGATSTNAHTFTVAPGVNVLEVTMDYANSLPASFGNLLILRLYGPDGTTYNDAGSVLFITDTPHRYLKIMAPTPGVWTAEARGARGVSSAPQASSPVAAAFPDTVNFSVDRAHYALGNVYDIAGHPHEPAIRAALSYRYMDVGAGGNFSPEVPVTRLDFAYALADNTPLRQATGPVATGDVETELRPLVRAVVAKGSTLRHFDFKIDGLLGVTSGGNFNAYDPLTRLDLAIALVRALGKDADARALDGTVVTTKDSAGNTVAVADLLQLPADKRGYAQLALTNGFVAPQFNEFGAPLFDLSGPITRAELAEALVAFRDFFSLE